ncbi:MAG: acyltransferase family protein [Blastocatellia bacterium]|nr:acyltransferase family protein [Blastocatellia bacterium]
MLTVVPPPAADSILLQVEAPIVEAQVVPKHKTASQRLAAKKASRSALPRTFTKSWASAIFDPFVDEEVDKRVREVPTFLNEYGFDPWGLNPLTARYGYTVFKWLYKYYWRVQVTGIENVPSGRVLLIANHSGQIPIDGVMISVAMLLESSPPRITRAMVERWFTSMPVVGKFVARHGSIVGDPLNCERLLQKGEAILVFPEGIRGSGKVWRDRYKLMKFGLGFMRLAIATNTPIVPIGVIGGEEQAPSFVDFKPLAKMLGLPYFPITPTFPWLGALGVIPYPTKYHIYFGKPLHFRGAADDRDEVIQRKVDVVKKSIRELIDRGLEERESIF